MEQVLYRLSLVIPMSLGAIVAAMLRTTGEFVLKKGAEFSFDCAMDLLNRRAALAVLEGRELPRGGDLVALVQRELIGLAKRQLTEHLDKIGYRSWISDAKAHPLFAHLLTNRLRGAPPEAEHIGRLIELYEAHSQADVHVVATILGKMHGDEAWQLLLRYLDELRYPQASDLVDDIILEKFSYEHPEGMSSYAVRSQSCNALRDALFDLAVGRGPSSQRARSILLRLERNRILSGRPSDETRHPRLSSGLRWPTTLYDS